MVVCCSLLKKLPSDDKIIGDRESGFLTAPDYISFARAATPSRARIARFFF
jgi:hypothetical protein